MLRTLGRSLFALAALTAASAASAQVTAERLQRASEEPQNWLTYSGTYASQRHTRLRQIVGAPLHVRKCRRRWIPTRDTVESSAAFVGLATPRHFNRHLGALEQRPRHLWDEALVEERHIVVAGITLRSDEPRNVVDRQPFGSK